MCLSEMDSLPEKVRKGILTKKQAAMGVMEVVYTNPCRFCLKNMSEDDRSDFLIEMLPAFEKMIERYDQKVSPFGAYLYRTIPGLRLSWSKRKIAKRAAESAMRPEIKDIYEVKQEKSLLVASPNAAPEGFLAENPRVVNQIFSRRFTKHRGDSYKKRIALVLAVKSAWYLDQSHIEKLSEFCELQKSDIESKIHDVRAMLLEKREKYSELEKRRDQAWFFVCRYREELSRMDKKSSAYQNTKRKLAYQLASWKRKNLVLQRSRRMNLENRAVAKILDLDPHTISSYISHAKKMGLADAI